MDDLDHLTPTQRVAAYRWRAYKSVAISRSKKTEEIRGYGRSLYVAGTLEALEVPHGDRPPPGVWGDFPGGDPARPLWCRLLVPALHARLWRQLVAVEDAGEPIPAATLARWRRIDEWATGRYGEAALIAARGSEYEPGPVGMLGRAWAPEFSPEEAEHLAWLAARPAGIPPRPAVVEPNTIEEPKRKKRGGTKSRRRDASPGLFA